MKKKTIGRGRSVTITEYEIDPRSIFDGKRRDPVRVTYYKPTREQHYTGLAALYGITRKPNQSLRSFAREVDKAIAAAMAKHQRKGE